MIRKDKPPAIQDKVSHRNIRTTAWTLLSALGHIFSGMRIQTKRGETSVICVIAEDKDDLVVVDRSWIEGKEIREPKVWDPVKELTTYIETLFGTDEKVGYVTKVWERDGRKLPSKGCFDRTARQLLQALSRCKSGDIADAVGDYDPEAGAWIRFNPLDGKDCRDENVTDYRYALVESDSVEKENGPTAS